MNLLYNMKIKTAHKQEVQNDWHSHGSADAYQGRSGPGARRPDDSRPVSRGWLPVAPSPPGSRHDRPAVHPPDPPWEYGLEPPAPFGGATLHRLGLLSGAHPVAARRLAAVAAPDHRLL